MFKWPVRKEGLRKMLPYIRQMTEEYGKRENLSAQ
jgi:hypothetical protein